MKTILITGGTGALGREVVKQHQHTEHQIRIMSRQDAPSSLLPHVQWRKADILTREGLVEALRGVDIVVNCASNPWQDTYETDVTGTKHMLQVARAEGVQHVLHISIVGIEHIPYTYYQHKLAAEEVVHDSGVPYSILRVTQFHTLLDQMLQMVKKISWLPVLPLPKNLQFQLIDPADVAKYLTPFVVAEPGGRLQDLGGPEVLTLAEIAREWMGIHGLRRPLIHVPFPGKVGQGFRAGYNTVPEHRYGTVTWRKYLHDKYVAKPQPQDSQFIQESGR